MRNRFSLFQSSPLMQAMTTAAPFLALLGQVAEATNSTNTTNSTGITGNQAAARAVLFVLGTAVLFAALCCFFKACGSSDSEACCCAGMETGLLEA